MNYGFMFLAIFLIVVLWITYRTLMAPTSVVSSQTYLQSKPKPVELSSLTNFNSMNYYYSLWIYVNNLNSPPSSNAADTNVPGMTGKLSNNIFYIVDGDGTKPYLSLDVRPDTSLVASIPISTSVSTTPPNPTGLTQYPITPNFSLQRWDHVVISVNQSYIDFYLDGKLIKSVNVGVNPTLPPANVSKPSKIHFGHGDVYIAGFQRISESIDPQTAWNIYLAGSGTTKSLINYGLSMTLSKNNTPSSTVTLF